MKQMLSYEMLKCYIYRQCRSVQMRARYSIINKIPIPGTDEYDPDCSCLKPHFRKQKGFV